MNSQLLYTWFRRLATNGSGLAVSAGIKRTNCPPTTKVCKKHYRSIQHFTPHCGKPMLAAALLSARSGVVASPQKTFLSGHERWRLNFFEGEILKIVWVGKRHTLLQTLVRALAGCGLQMCVPFVRCLLFS